MTKLSRLTEDFVRIFGDIKSQFPKGFDSGLFRTKLTSQSFEALVQRFDLTVFAITHSEKTVAKKHFKQVHREFPRAWAEYKKAWSSITVEYISHRVGNFDLGTLLDDQAHSNDKATNESEWEDWEFDSDRQDAACLVDAMVAYASEHAEYGGVVFHQMAEAFDWFRNEALTSMHSCGVGTKSRSHQCRNTSLINIRPKGRRAFTGFLIRRVRLIGSKPTQRRSHFSEH